MSEDQVMEDISMTAQERLEVAFRLSDLALEIQKHQEAAREDPDSSIHWIELHKVSSGR